MSVLYIGIGLVCGVAATYYFQNKNVENNPRKDNSQQLDFLTDQNRKLKEELSSTTSELESLKTDYKRARDQRDAIDDKKDDFEMEITKLKRTNSGLSQEIEKLKTDLYEYEMLYNARKEEIAQLKKQLENNGK